MSGLFSTLTQGFAESTEKFSKHTVFEFKRNGLWERLSYAELRQRVNLVSRYLVEQGVRKHDRIALMLETSPEWGIFYFGIMFAGAVCVPLDPMAQKLEVSNILDSSQCRILFVSSDNAKKLEKLQGELPGLKEVTVVEDIKTHLFKEEHVGGPLLEPDTEADDLASMLYTSGTTAKPKGVMLSHGNFTSNFRSIRATELYYEDTRVLSILPLYHSYAFMITLITPIFSGARIIYPESMTAEDIFRCVKEKDVSFFVAVPQILYLIQNKISSHLRKLPLFARLILYAAMNLLWFIRRITGVNLSKLVFARIHREFGRKFEFFASGGARLDPKKALGLFKLGFTVLEGYGLTETSPVAAFNTPNCLKIGSVGKAVEGVTIKIDNPDSSGVGEVVIKGPNVMKGYYKEKEATDKVLKDGLFHTGDLGYLTKDGFLYLVGRSKEVIVLSSGKNIYPEELELHYGKSHFVKELCLLGANQIREDTSFDGLYAVVVPDIEHFKKGGETDLERVIRGKLEDLSRDLPSYKRILKFIIAKDSIPRTRLGKIKRYQVLNSYRDAFLGKPGLVEEKLSDEDKKLVSSDVGGRVLKCISQETGLKRDIYPDESLELGLGIDSLTRIEIISSIEEEFRLGIPRSFAAEVFYVRDVIKGVSDMLKEKRAAPEARAEALLKDEEFWPGALKQKPIPEILEKIELKPGISSKAFTLLISAIFLPFFKIFHNLKIYGKDFIPRDEKPLILCANHTSYYDALVVVFSLPLSIRMKLFFFGFKGYFQVPVIRNMVKMMRVIPIDTAKEVLNGMQSASYVLNNNKMLCIFPEGQRSFDGEIKKLKKGIGILAKELNARLLPVVIEGTHRAWPRANPFPRLFYPIRIYFGKPLDCESLLSKAPQGPYQDDYERIASGLREELINLRNKFSPSNV